MVDAFSSMDPGWQVVLLLLGWYLVGVPLVDSFVLLRPAVQVVVVLVVGALVALALRGGF